MDTDSGRRLKPTFLIWVVALAIPTIAYASAEVSSEKAAAAVEAHPLEYPTYPMAFSLDPVDAVGDQTLRESLMLQLHRQHLRDVATQLHLRWVREQQAKEKAGAQALASPPSSLAARVPDWYATAQCESGGAWATNTGNGFWGGLQFLPSTWFAFGGGPFDGSGPFPYSAAYQIAVAERVLAGQGSGAWPHCFHWR